VTAVRDTSAGAQGLRSVPSSLMFWPTGEDVRILDAELRPGESDTDVLRRALRALERRSWRGQAYADMQRIAEVGDDLGDEPDEW
jgi:hypothetical protein